MFIFKKIRIKSLLCALLILDQCIVPGVALAGPGDGLRVDTINSHITARGLAKGLVARRLMMAAEDFSNAYAAQFGLLDNIQNSKENALQLSKLTKEIDTFGMGSVETSVAIEKIIKTKTDEYLSLYDRSSALLARAQDSVGDAVTLTQQMRQFANNLTTLCQTGESEVMPTNLLPPLNIPSPEINIYLGATLSSQGTYQGSVILPAVASPKINGLAPTMVSAGTAAILLKTGLVTSTLIASGIGLGVGLVVAAIMHFIGMSQAIDDAADISSAQIDNFLHGANGKDVAKYYREECAYVTGNFGEFLRLSTLIEKSETDGIKQAKDAIEASKSKFENFERILRAMYQIRAKIAQETNTDLTLRLDVQESKNAFKSKLDSSIEYRALLSNLNSISSADLSAIVTATMLELQINNVKIVSTLRSIGLDTFLKVKNQAFKILANLNYRAYLKTVSERYGAALIAVKEDLQVAERLEKIRLQFDLQIAHTILLTANGSSLSETKDNIVRIEIEVYRLLSAVKSKEAKIELGRLIDSMTKVLKLM